MTSPEMTPELNAPEFSHAVPLSEIGGKAVMHKLTANAEERAALARRFGLLSLDHFSASISLSRDDAAIVATGKLDAQLTQACVATGLPVPAQVTESFSIRFLPESEHEPDAEIELGADDCDTMFHDGRTVDLGEAAAQTLALAIDPYPRSPDAEAALKKAGVKGEHEAGPFAALAALRKGGE
jgi:uncharacterized metal-binding protein YceD (DUF177 family)